MVTRRNGMLGASCAILWFLVLAPRVALGDCCNCIATFTANDFTSPIAYCGPATGATCGQGPADTGGFIDCTVNPVITGGTCSNGNETGAGLNGVCNPPPTSTPTETPTATQTSTATPTNTPMADLSVTKSDSPDPVIAGNNLTYTVTAGNAGTADASMAVVNDTLPSQTRFVSCQSTLSGVCGGTGNNRTVTYTTIKVGDSPVTTLVTRVCPETACNATLSNTAVISSDTPDGNLSNNTSPADTTTVKAESDMMITKNNTPDQVIGGASINYIVEVMNGGPSDSPNTTLVDTLPPGFKAQAIVPDQGSCSGVGTGTVNCNLGTVGAANQCTTTLPTTVAVHITVLVPVGFKTGPVVNNATVSTGACNGDPNLLNNSADSTANVNRAAPAMSAVALAFCALLLAAGGAWLRVMRRSEQ